MPKETSFKSKDKKTHQHIVVAAVQLLAEHELGVLTSDRFVAKAHILALVVDNISNYMLTGIELDQRDIWTETARNVLK